MTEQLETNQPNQEPASKEQASTSENQPVIGISRELANLRAKLYSDIRYNLTFDLRSQKETTSGQVRVDLKIARPLQPLVIDFKGLGRLPDQINGKLKTQTIFTSAFIKN